MTERDLSGIPLFRNDSRCARCGAGYEIWVMFCRACKEAPDIGDHYHRECRCGHEWVELCESADDNGNRSPSS